MRTELQKNQNVETKDVEKMENRRTVIPAVDIFENDNEIWMVADLPGVNEKDVEVHFEKQTLRISGRVKPVDSSWRRMLREYVPTDFERSFKLPSGLDVSKFSADYENGVLTLHLPKSEDHRPHMIQINAHK